MRYRLAVLFLFGIGTYVLTLEEAGHALQVSRERIAATRAAALRRLGCNPCCRGLLWPFWSALD
jgi:hypothetical protein